MGYRLYFYPIEKTLVSKIQKAKTKQEAIQIAKPDHNDDYLGVYEFADESMGYEFGKEHDIISKLAKGNRKLKWFHDSDHDCYVGTEKMALRALEHYREKVISYHEKGRDNIEELCLDSKLRWLKADYLFNTNPDDYEVTGVWLYEYSMFNLVSYIKKINWKTHNILFTGW